MAHNNNLPHNLFLSQHHSPNSRPTPPHQTQQETNLATLLSEMKLQPPPPPSVVQAFRNSTIYQQNQYSIKNFTWSDLPTLGMQQFDFYVQKNRISWANRKQFPGTSPMFTSSEWLLPLPRSRRILRHSSHHRFRKNRLITPLLHPITNPFKVRGGISRRQHPQRGNLDPDGGEVDERVPG